MSEPLIIAIDGPSASGKGTLARRLAEALNLAHLDTGMIYRAVGSVLLEAGRDPADEAAAEAAARALTPADLVRPDLRAEEVGRAASQVAAQPAVRQALLEFQRHFAADPPAGPGGKPREGAVLDGRDIGTVVCPGAKVKLFLVADDETRATRRFKELKEKGEGVIYARVLQDLRDRDARDSGRSTAPMRPAEDAKVLDSSSLDPEAVFEEALNFVAARREGRTP